MMKKHTIKIFFLLMASVFFLNMSVLNASADQRKFKTSWRLEFWDNVYLMGEFDKKYGLEAQPVKFTSGVEAMEGVLSRTVEIGNLGHIPAMIMLSKDPNYYMLAAGGWFDGSAYRMVVRKDSPYKSLEDLKGKVIATKIGSGSYTVLLKMIKEKGFKEKDFKILNSTPPEIISAMEQGSVDAALWFEPTMSLIQHKGWGKIIFDFKGYADSYSFYMVHQEFADKNPDTIVRFLAGVMDAQYELENNRWIASKLISDAYASRGRRIPPEVFYNSLSTIRFVPWTDDIKGSMSSEWGFLAQKGKVRGKEPDWNKIINTDFLKRADQLREKTNFKINSNITKESLK
jgi:sulfonate transport system substrate-binding protein